MVMSRLQTPSSGRRDGPGTTRGLRDLGWSGAAPGSPQSGVGHVLWYHTHTLHMNMMRFADAVSWMRRLGNPGHGASDLPEPTDLLSALFPGLQPHNHSALPEQR